MNSFVLGFQDIDKHKLSAVGGKGANLGELSKIKGIQVPEGFCVTTASYKKTFENNEELNDLLKQLSYLKANERKKINAISGQIRVIIEGVKIPSDIEEAVTGHISNLGEGGSYAVRSSATAEDLPTASFAGQQDTYLNIIGKDSILKHISKCWASLFTDRAVTYRIQNGFDHRKVYLSVVIQRMVFPQASGIMFTADPVTSNPKVLSIDASFGLGEALVSGLVSADIYKVREGSIVEKKISTKKLAIYALKEGGTEQREIDAEQKMKQTLKDNQIIQLESIGRKIEKYFSYPQDIEWCLVDGKFYIVQSRPITTLYPVPKATDGKNHVYISGGHMQMMTDPIKPLGMFFFQIVVGDHPSREIGGRLYMDITHDLASPFSRSLALFLMKMIGEDLMLNAVKGLVKRKGLTKSLPRGKEKVFIPDSKDKPSMGFISHYIRIYRENDPVNIRKIIDDDQRVITDLQKDIDALSGNALFSFIENSLRNMKKVVVSSESTGALTVAMLAMQWVNKKLEKWLGEKNLGDTLIQSVPNSITADIGLALMDVSDVVRQYPAVVDYLNHANDQSFYQALAQLEGGSKVIDAIDAYLQLYSMRCSGDIDITRLRWNEQPTALIPTILSNIKNFPMGGHQLKYEQGLKDSKLRVQALLDRLKQCPGGNRKAKKAQKKIDIMRNHIGYREYPKHAFVMRYDIYKKALLKEADVLVQRGLLQNREDIYYLYFDEFQTISNTHELDYSIITKRKADYEIFDMLTPPRVITTEDGIIAGVYHSKNTVKGALPGIPVSSGIIEGRARVIHSMEEADISEGDILVTAFTDPSWTPVFVSLKGLVTEVGGLMTHGAVIAREYGLPAVVSVENATKLINDGDMIRVNGTEGYVEILSE
ncbi:MAG: phosphoenolpyruvate synthase [Clostridiales bacterium]|nr:phosphoenolpyruvate synthase [Clostridiales bacterium]